MFLSPDHALFLEGVLIPVKYLLNGDSIVQLECAFITYYHVELACHDIILADGLPAETFLDIGNRSVFANGGEVTALHPDFAPAGVDYLMLWEAHGYAPLMVTGLEVERARQLSVRGLKRRDSRQRRLA